jgi:hypothetical protein
MRRFLLGGLGIALGALAQPALAQQPISQPQTRAAAFGRPSAVSTQVPTNADPAVTPAGAYAPPPTYAPPVTHMPPVVTYAPGTFGTPAPVTGTAPGDVGPMAQPGTGTPPRTGTGGPTVTESRDPTGRIPTGTVVPSVAPDAFVGPDPCLDDPLYAGSQPNPCDRLHGVSCGRNWVTAEVLLWWNRSTQVPPLVTTSSPQFNGILGQGDTRTLLGGSFGSTYHVGARFGFGHWFDDYGCRGMDAHVFWVAPSTATFAASDPPLPLLARPFFNTNPNVMMPNVGVGPTAEVIAGPGVATGTVVANLKSTVWGADVNYRRFLAGTPLARIDGLIGYRYLDVHEDLTISESFERIPGSNPMVGVPAQSGVITDQFRTENQFHGGQIGLASTVQRGRWSLDGRSTIAFGTVFQTVQINGGQVLAFPNGTIQTAQGGLLAVPGTNIGRFSQARFAVVPEVGVNLGYQLTQRTRLFVGYNFLYLSSAVRPGNVIDTNIDAARVPNLLQPGVGVPAGPVHPVPLLHTSGYFIQGISFGMMYRW